MYWLLGCGEEGGEERCGRLSEALRFLRPLGPVLVSVKQLAVLPARCFLYIFPAQ